MNFNAIIRRKARQIASITVAIILVGSYLCMEIFDLPLKYAVGTSVSAAFFGGLVAYIYLKRKVKQANLLPKHVKPDEKLITKKRSRFCDFFFWNESTNSRK